MQQQQQQQSTLAVMSGIVNTIGWAAQCLCKPVEVILRRWGTFGHRYLNYQAAIGFLFLLVFPAFFLECYAVYYQTPYSPYVQVYYVPYVRPGYEYGPMLYFTYGVIGAFFLHTVARGCRTQRYHSMYTGTPWLSFFGELTAKRMLEPVLVIVSGILLLGFNVPLGAYLLVSGAALWVDSGMQAAWDEARIRQALDAQIDASILMNEVQKRRGY